MKNLRLGVVFLGIFIFLGLGSLGYFIERGARDFRLLGRSVTVKGLSENEVLADVVVWPIQFRVTGDKLPEIYQQLGVDAQKISDFLTKNGIEKSEITVSSPSVEDKMIYQYGEDKAPFRYVATQVVTVYSKKVEKVYEMKNMMGELIKTNVSLGSESESQEKIDFLFTRLNDLKPKMIEESVKNARDVAEKFAKDSNSKLGKIKSANQGLFTIEDRDTHNPQIKKIRVVSTVEYFLTD